MSLWGNSDNLFSSGTVSVNLVTKVATVSTGTLPAAAVLEGAVLTVEGKGSAVIKERLTNTTFSIINTTGLDGTPISAVTYNISGQPVYLNEDGNWGGNEIYGVDTAEQAFTNSGSAATAEQKKYNPAHAGWVGITTYMDMHNNLRVKTEVFVAGSTITGDAGDDAQLPE